MGVLNIRKIWLIGCLVIGPLYAQKEELTVKIDSVKYGRHTTFAFSLEDLKMGADTSYVLDTLLNSLGLINIRQKSRYSYENLGSLGTATRPLFYSSPEEIGRRSGLTAYTPFFTPTNRIPHYNTYSSYIHAKALLGDEDRGLFKVLFTQNITPSTNFGIHLHRISTEPQLGPRFTSGERQILSVAYQVFFSTVSRSNKYALSIVFSRLAHQAREYGGSVFDIEDPKANRFAYRNAVRALSQANSFTWRYGTHIFQRIAIVKDTHLYLQAQTSKERFFFFNDLEGSSPSAESPTSFPDTSPPTSPTDPESPIVSDKDFYSNFFHSETRTEERQEFESSAVETGLIYRSKARHSRLYVRRRWTRREDSSDPEIPLVREEFYGLKWYEYLTKNLFLYGKAESMTESRRFYHIYLQLHQKYGAISVWRKRYKPSLLMQSFVGNHHMWQNNFSPVAEGGAEVSLHLTYRNASLRPKIRFSEVSNYVYFDSLQAPRQLSYLQKLQLSQAEVEAKVALFKKKLVLEPLFRFQSHKSDSLHVLAFPKRQFIASIYYQDLLFKKTMYVQIGFRVHWRDKYFGFAYQPATQSFYPQDAFILRAYTEADLFIRYRISNFEGFMQISHLSRPPGSGYFTTPFYPGEPRFLDIGISWRFFD